MAKLNTLLLLGGAAALLLFSGSKKGAGGVSVDIEKKLPVKKEVPPTDPPPVKTDGPSGGTAPTDTWKQRQEALKFVSAMTDCKTDPGSIDGVFGSKTKKALKNFQGCVGLTKDGAWGPKTEAAMKKMLSDIALGQVEILVDVTKKASEKEEEKIKKEEKKEDSDQWPRHLAMDYKDARVYFSPGLSGTTSIKIGDKHGEIVHITEKFTDSLDEAFDYARFWIEDNLDSDQWPRHLAMDYKDARVYFSPGLSGTTSIKIGDKHGEIVHITEKFTDSLDEAFDYARFWIEDNL